MHELVKTWARRALKMIHITLFLEWLTTLGIAAHMIRKAGSSIFYTGNKLEIRDMTWLMLNDEKSTKLGDDIRLLESINTLNDCASRLQLDRYGIEDTPEVLRRLIAGRDDREMEGLLHRLDIDARELRWLIERFLKAQLSRHIPDEIETLALKFGELKQTGDTDPYRWPLIDSGFSPSSSALPDLSLVLTAQGQLQAHLELKASPPPPPAESEDHRLPSGVLANPYRPAILRIALSGEATLQGALQSSGTSANISLGASGQGDAAMEFYFAHALSRRVGGALVVDLKALTSHPNITRISSLQQLLAGHLQALRVEANHQLRFDGKLGFNLPLGASGALVSANLEPSFRFDLTESGRFEYIVSRADDGVTLAVQIRRVTASVREWERALEAKVDMSRWASDAFPVIRDYLGRAADVVEQIQGFLPGEHFFQEHIKNALTKAIAHSPYKTDLLSVLGFEPGADLTQVIEQKLLPRVTTVANGWGEELREEATALAWELIDRLPINLSQEGRKALQSTLDSELKRELERLRERLEGRLDELIRGHQLQDLTAALASMGHQVSAADTSLQRLLEPVRQTLQQAQQKLAEVAPYFEQAASAKVSAKFKALSREENSQGLDLTLQIDPRDEARAQRALDQLISGRLDQVIADLNSSDSESVRITGGKFERYQRLMDESGFEIVLFGFGFSSGITSDAQTRIIIDPQGDIQVISTLEWEKRYGNQRRQESRSLSIVNAYSLAVAKKSRSATLGISLQVTDQELHPKEVAPFLGSAEEIGLLPPGTRERGVAALERVTSGQLMLSMTLTQPQLLRMLQLDSDQIDSDQIDSDQIDSDRLLRIAAPRMIDVARAAPNGKRFIEQLSKVRDYIDDPSFKISIGDRPEDLIIDLTPQFDQRARRWIGDVDGDGDGYQGNIPDALRVLDWAQARRRAVIGCRQECVEREENQQLGLLDTLEALREIYLANPDQGVSYYNEQQKAVGRGVENWFHWPQEQGESLMWWLLGREEIRPLNLALFDVLRTLARGHGEGVIMLDAVLTLDKGKRRIPLT